MEVKCRYPRSIKNWGFIDLYKKWLNKWYKWKEKLPKNGEKIKITWLPKNNTYIGFEGIVESVNINECYFFLNSGKSVLVCSESFNYIKL